MKNGTDCHFHILPGKGTVADYQTLAKKLKLERGIVVQASNAGIDNTPLLKALDQLGPHYRAIGGTDFSLPDQTLLAWREKGMRGTRLNPIKGEIPSWADIEQYARRIEPLGWVLDFFLAPEHLLEWGPKMEHLPTPLLIDHFGMMGAKDSLKPLLRLIDRGRCYVKISAPYRLAHPDPDTLARTLIQHAPERMLWASDWPHTQFEEAKIDDEASLHRFLGWAGPHAQKILVDNPASLFF